MFIPNDECCLASFLQTFVFYILNGSNISYRYKSFLILVIIFDSALTQALQRYIIVLSTFWIHGCIIYPSKVFVCQRILCIQMTDTQVRKLVWFLNVLLFFLKGMGMTLRTKTIIAMFFKKGLSSIIFQY